MAKSKQERYDTNRESLGRYADEGKISERERDRIIEFLDANDPDRPRSRMSDGKTKAPGTLARYSRNVGRVARDLDVDLTEATAEDINELMENYLIGEVESAKDEGLSNGTVSKMQGPMRRFYLFHDDLSIVPEDIFMTQPEKKTVSEREVFSTEDKEGLREAARNSGVRDICIVDLLLYTGQRKSAILNLRLKDINLEDGTFHLNEEAGDLKGATGKRPLLGAEKSVRDLVRQHPTGEPEDHLITQKIDQSHRDGVETGDKLNGTTVYALLKRIANEAGVTKDFSAHQYRHFFVTTAIRDYDMKPDTVKRIIGHKPSSTVLEETYAHLTDDDIIDKAQEATGIKEPEKDKPLTPNFCDRCDEPLQDEWEACPACGMQYSPTAYQRREDIDQALWDDQGVVGPDSAESDALADLRDLLRENPEVVSDLINN